MKSSGKCKIDGVDIGEVSINLAVPATPVSATYAYTSGDDRVGRGNRNVGWSEATMTKLKEFLLSMENDIVADLFEGGTTDSVEAEEADTSDGVSSL